MKIQKRGRKEETPVLQMEREQAVSHLQQEETKWPTGHRKEQVGMDRADMGEC